MQDIATIEKTGTTEPFKNVTFEETIVANGHQGNKLKRKFLSNPVTRSILDEMKKTAGSTLRDYEIKSLIKEPSNSEKEQDTTGLQISKELVIPTPRPTSKEIEEMSEEELLRETERSTLRDYEVTSKIKELSSLENEQQDTTISKEIEDMSEEELLRQYDDISNKLKHDHIKLERRV